MHVKAGGRSDCRRATGVTWQERTERYQMETHKEEEESRKKTNVAESQRSVHDECAICQKLSAETNKC